MSRTNYGSLKEEGLTENTLVWFLSYNEGGPHPSHPSNNLSLRGFQGTMYEDGIRVLFVLSWHGTVRACLELDWPVTALDIGATAYVLNGGDLSEVDLHGMDCKKGNTHTGREIQRDNP